MKNLFASKPMLTLGFWRTLKCYLELPFRRELGRNEWKTHIPLCGGLYIGWSDYDFELCDSREYFPRGQKNGKHRLTFNVGIFYWWIRLTFYSPKTCL